MVDKYLEAVVSLFSICTCVQNNIKKQHVQHNASHQLFILSTYVTRVRLKVDIAVFCAITAWSAESYRPLLTLHLHHVPSPPSTLCLGHSACPGKLSTRNYSHTLRSPPNQPVGWYSNTTHYKYIDRSHSLKYEVFLFTNNHNMNLMQSNESVGVSFRGTLES